MTDNSLADKTTDKDKLLALFNHYQNNINVYNKKILSILDLQQNIKEEKNQQKMRMMQSELEALIHQNKEDKKQLDQQLAKINKLKDKLGIQISSDSPSFYYDLPNQLK